MKSKVFPIYFDEPEYDGSFCEYIECEHCAKIFAFWLDEEYIEPQKPEVDWSKVPVDTLVRVRDGQDGPGVLMYFCCYTPDSIYKFKTWEKGKTSKTADGIQRRLFCELVEDEDGSN